METTTDQTNKEKSLQCNFCDKLFTKRKNLNIHLCIHTGERKLSCSICGKRFIQSCHLKRHYRSHAGEKPFQCEICGKYFTQNGHLKVHMKSHFGNKNFTCEYCQRSFVQNSQLKRHMRSHLTERPYACTYCNKSYKFSDHLHAHIRTHTGEMPYKCGTCEKAFHTSANLNAHRKVHDKYVDRKYKCLLCVKKFHTKHCLTKHLVVHSQETPFSCSFCSKTFKQKTSLKVHIDCHSKELESKDNVCVICEKSYPSFCKLKEHVMEHCMSTTFQCEICDKVFRVNSNLQMHYSQHTGYKMAYRCLESNCVSEFSTIPDTRNHIIEKHRCDLNEDEKTRLAAAADDDDKLVEQEQGSKKQSSPKDNVDKQVTLQGMSKNNCIDENKKTYLCPVNCGNSFKNITSLSNHLQIHIAEEGESSQSMEVENEDMDDEDENIDEEEMQVKNDDNKSINPDKDSNEKLDAVRSDIPKSHGIHCFPGGTGVTQQRNGQVITFSNIDPLSNNRMFHIGQVCSELLTVDYGCNEEIAIQSKVPDVHVQNSMDIDSQHNYQARENSGAAGNSQASTRTQEVISTVVMLPKSSAEKRDDETINTKTSMLSSDIFHDRHMQPSHTQQVRLHSTETSELKENSVLHDDPQQCATSKVIMDGPLSCVSSGIEGLLSVGEVILQESPGTNNLDRNMVSIGIPSHSTEMTDSALIFQETSPIVGAISPETEEVVTQESSSNVEDHSTSQEGVRSNSAVNMYSNLNYSTIQQEQVILVKSSVFGNRPCSDNTTEAGNLVGASKELASVNTCTQVLEDHDAPSSSCGSSQAGVSYHRHLTAEEMGHDYPSTSFMPDPCCSESVQTEVETETNLEPTSSSPARQTVMFECPLCDSYFSSKTELKEHLQMHLGDRQRMENILVSIVMYLCHLCEEEFTDKDTLRNHIQDKHAKVSLSDSVS